MKQTESIMLKPIRSGGWKVEIVISSYDRPFWPWQRPVKVQEFHYYSTVLDRPAWHEWVASAGSRPMPLWIGERISQRLHELAKCNELTNFRLNGGGFALKDGRIYPGYDEIMAGEGVK
jgi:hypothetical protein